MTPETALLQYMRAAVRAQNPRDVDAWPAEELRAVFQLIPLPGLNFEDWCARMGYMDDAQADPDQLTEEQTDANQSFIDYLAKAKTEPYDPEE